MRKMKKWKQGVLLVTAAAVLVAGWGLLLGRMGAECELPDTIVVEAASTQDGVAMGRYLESDLPLPEDIGLIHGVQILDDGTLRIAYMDGDYNLCCADSGDMGQTWQEPVLVKELLGITREDQECSRAILARDGGIFASLYTETGSDDGEISYQYFYCSPEGEVRELPLGELLDIGYLYAARFTDKGTILLEISGGGVAEVSLEDGSLVRRYEEGSYVGNFGLAGDCLITVMDDTLHFYDVNTGNPMEGGEALTELTTADPQNLTITSISEFPILFAAGDESGTLFYLDHKGLYRFAFGGSVVEQIMDGSLNAVGSPQTGFVDLVMDENGVFYLAALDYSSGDAKGRLLRYEYSQDTPSVPGTELSVYSLTDNELLRAAAAVFQKDNPDVYVNLEVGMTGDDAVTTSDALRTLSTEIMAGQGPDILMLDGIPAEAYAEKGLLADLSGILDRVEASEGLLTNIREAYTQEDGTIFKMPMRFGIPLIVGKKEDMEQITDLVSLADVIEAHREEYALNFRPFSVAYSPEGVLISLEDVCSPAWLTAEGTLDEEKVSEFYEQAGRIYQSAENMRKEMAETYGEDVLSLSILDELSENKAYWGISAGAMQVGDYELLNFGGLFSGYSLEAVTSAEGLNPELTYQLCSGQAQGCFIPLNTVGISSQARNPEEAEAFVEFLFGSGAQKLTSGGLPVNRAVYEDAKYWSDEEPGEVTSVLSSYNASTGEDFSVEIKAPPLERIQEMQDLGKTLTVPSLDNRIILEAVRGSGLRYLNGEISLEEAVRAAIQEVNLYLSE